MGRAKGFDPERQLDYAMAAFWRRGYAGTSTQDLVRSMGIGKRSLYDTYGSKRDVYRKALGRYIARADTGQREILAAGAGPRESLLAILNATIDVATPTPPGCFAVVCSADAGAEDPEVVAMAAGYFDRSTAALCSLIKRMKGDAITVDEAHLRASIMHDAWVGIRVRLAIGLPQQRAQELAVELVRAALS